MRRDRSDALGVASATPSRGCSSSRRSRTSLLAEPLLPIALPNVRAKLPAEARSVSLVRDDAPRAADQAYAACRSGSA